MNYLIAIALLAAVVLSVGCSSGDNATTTPSPTHANLVSSSSTQSATPTSAPATATPTTAPTATPSSNVCQANPNPATSAQTVVNQPLPGAQVTSPLTVSGMIAAFEAQFNIAIKDASGANIVAQAGHSQQGQMLSPFSESVPFTVTAATPACLWVFDISAADGVTATQVIQVPITLVP